MKTQPANTKSHGAQVTKESGDRFPKSSPPRFALPGHEWMLADDLRVRGGGFAVIRAVKGWILVRRTHEKKTGPVGKYEAYQRAEMARRQLKKPEVGFSPPNASEHEREALTLSRVMKNLAKLAKNGNQKEAIEAAALLEWLVKHGCELLTEVAEERAEILIPTAERECDWPLLVALHPGSEHSQSRCRELLEELKLGRKAAEYANEPMSRSGTKTTERMRHTRAIAQRLLYCLLAEWEYTGGRLRGQTVPRWRDDDQVPTIWCSHAKARFFEAYPHPEEIEELREYVSPSRKNCRAHVKVDVWRKVQSALRSLAPVDVITSS